MKNKKKSYNPLKILWGYIGMILFFVYSLSTNTSGFGCGGKVYTLLISNSPCKNIAIQKILILSFIGFFIGWGIYLLITKIRNN